MRYHSIFCAALLLIYAQSVSSMQFLSDTYSFAKAFLNDPTNTGSIVPSSSWLAEEITSRIPRQRNQPISILEAGPGTGVFTQAIINKLRDHDTLTTVELDTALAERLQTQCASSNVNVINSDICKVGTTNQFDFIISGLPFNNFQESVVKTIVAHYHNILKPGGTLSYFEYAILPELFYALHPNTQEWERYQKVQNTLKQFKKAHTTETNFVWLNAPCAYVHHITTRATTSTNED